MKYHNQGDDRNYLVDYSAWVSSLKLPLKDRRLAIVEEALGKICGGADSFTVAQAREHFGFEVFPKWCEMIGVEEKDEACVGK